MRVIIFVSIFLLSTSFIKPSYGTSCSSSSYNCSVNLHNSVQDYIYVEYRYFHANTLSTLTIETKNLSPNSDTVLLISDVSSGNVVCRNDDWNGLGASKLTIGGISPNCTIPSSGYYKLIIRSFSNADGGTCDLVENGNVILSSIAFGGRWWNVGFSTNSSFQTATVSTIGENQVDTVLLLAVGLFSTQVVKTDDDGGIGYSSLIKTGNLNGTGNDTYIILGRYYSTNYNGNYSTVKIVKNDTDNSFFTYTSPALCNNLNDLDCDGLGNKLEEALGTCPCIVGKDVNCPLIYNGIASCKNVFDSRDTDGDGLPDAYEVFGRKLTLSGNSYDIELSRFGADPLHKDVFIEVQYSLNSSSSSTHTKITAADFQKICAAFAEGPGSSNYLNNPDNLNGIRLHIDQNNFNSPVYCQSDSRSKIASMSNIQDFLSSNDASLPINRIGLWRLGVLFPSNIPNSAPGEYQIYLNKYPRTWIHEIGHSLGLTHWGPHDSPISFAGPNYTSVMNYATHSQLPYGSKFFKGDLPSINPSSVNEMITWGNLTNKDNLKHLEEPPFNFKLIQDNNGNLFVDWNRTTVLDTGSSSLYINNMTSLPVQYTRNDLHHYNNQNSSNVTSGLSTQNSYTLGTSLVKFQSRLYLCSVDSSGKLILKKRLPNKNWSNVSLPGNIPDAFSSPATVSTNISNENRLYFSYVALINGARSLVVFYMRTDESFSSTSQINSTSFSIAYSQTPEFFFSANILSLFFIDSTGRVSKTTLNTSSGWGNPINQTDNSSNTLISKTGVSVINDGINTLMFSVSSTDDSIHVLKKTGSNNWLDLGFLKISPGNTPTPTTLKSSSKVSVSYQNSSSKVKGFHLLYKSSLFSGDLKRAFIPSSSPLSISVTLNPGIANDADIAAPSIFTDTTGEVHAAILRDNGTLFFLPYADGIINVNITSPNDWAGMKRLMCWALTDIEIEVSGTFFQVGLNPQVCEVTQ